MRDRNAMTDGGKELYEALQALNAHLTEAEEQLLVDLVEKIRTSLRAEKASEWPYTKPSTIGQTEGTLRRWIEFDAVVKEPEPQAYAVPDPN